MFKKFIFKHIFYIILMMLLAQTGSSSYPKKNYQQDDVKSKKKASQDFALEDIHAPIQSFNMMTADHNKHYIFFEGYLILGSKWFACLKVGERRFFFSHINQCIAGILLVQFSPETQEVVLHLEEPNLCVLSVGHGHFFYSKQQFME